MNWLEMYAVYAAAPTAIIIIILQLVKRKVHCSSNVEAGLDITSIVIGMVVFMLSPIYFLNKSDDATNWGGYNSHEDYKLISLENSPSSSGSFYRGTGSNSPDMGCAFALEAPDQTVQIIVVSSSDVTFHPNDDGIVKVSRHNATYTMPLAIDPDKVHATNYYHWHIWIPRDSMNRYIKFN